jgi:hypothetical protein
MDAQQSPDDHYNYDAYIRDSLEMRDLGSGQSTSLKAPAKFAPHGKMSRIYTVIGLSKTNRDGES